MMETLEHAFAATHTLNGVPVMRNPNWRPGGPLWIDEAGTAYRSGAGRKSEPIVRERLSVATMEAKGEEFGETYGVIGEVIPAEWWKTQYRPGRGVMVTREAAAAALRACAWPDSAAPCGMGSSSNDDDATFTGYDAAGNCIVRLFMRGKGYFKVKIPRAMFLEIVDE